MSIEFAPKLKRKKYQLIYCPWWLWQLRTCQNWRDKSINLLLINTCIDIRILQVTPNNLLQGGTFQEKTERNWNSVIWEKEMFYLFDPEICGHDLVLQILKQQVLGIGTGITNFYTSIISHTIALYWSYNHERLRCDNHINVRDWHGKVAICFMMAHFCWAFDQNCFA